MKRKYIVQGCACGGWHIRIPEGHYLGHWSAISREMALLIAKQASKNG